MPAAQLVEIGPGNLTLDVNVRTTDVLDAKDPDDAAFLDSVRAYGVLQPIVAHHGHDGGLRVVYGKRRTLAAQAAGLQHVPVYVVDDLDEADRIATQVVENDQRRALTTTERTAAWEQLAALGVSVEDIAARTGHTADRVRTGLRVAESKVAAKVVARYDLTLDQAAVVAELADDKDAVKTLTVTARTDPERFDHVAQRLRDDKAAREAKQAVVDDLEAKGILIITNDQAWDRRSMALSRLKASADGQYALRPSRHAKCPGHAAVIGREWDKDDQIVYAPTYYCTDWRANDHHPLHGTRDDTGSRPAGGGMTDQEKTERRQVIAGNKAWRSAQTVRRAWLTNLLAQPKPPKGAAAHLATYLVRSHGWDRWRTDSLLKDLAGDVDAELGRHPTEDRATVLALAVVLVARESELTDNTWRNPGPLDRAHFTALATWGYQLSDVEQRVAGASTTDDQPDEQPVTAPDATSTALAGEVVVDVEVSDEVL